MVKSIREAGRGIPRHSASSFARGRRRGCRKSGRLIVHSIFQRLLTRLTVAPRLPSSGLVVRIFSLHHHGDTPAAAPPAGRRIRIHGTVQGVGFRPWVYRIATATMVTGRVRNDTGGVTVEVFG